MHVDNAGEGFEGGAGLGADLEAAGDRDFDFAGGEVEDDSDAAAAARFPGDHASQVRESAGFSDEYPQAVARICDPPLLLYCQGELQPRDELAVAIVGAACGSSGNNNVSSGRFKGTGLTGAGSTFAQPMYAQWANSFNKLESAAKVNYQAIGSGGGVEQFTAKTVDFGATDVPLQSAEISAVKGNWIEFPTAREKMSEIV